MSALIPLPSTPRLKSATISTPEPALPPSPGTWRHPRFSEIVSRRNASIFSEQDLKRAAFNLIPLLLSLRFSSELYVIAQTVARFLPQLLNGTDLTRTYITYTLLALRLYLLLNFSLALLPLVSAQANDTVSDIPLTPSQRALMGLPPSPSPSKRTPIAAAAAALTAPFNVSTSTPASPIAYISPPRYKRTTHSASPSSSTGGDRNNSARGPTTPSPSRSISALYSPTYSSSSPLSGRGTPAFPQSPGARIRSLSTSTSIDQLQKTDSNRLFSPPTRSTSGSPLLQKALAFSTNDNNNQYREHGETFRTSLSPSAPGSGLRRSQSVRDGAGVGVDVLSPGSRNESGRRSPAVNYKWLYEKEKRNQARVGAAGLLSRRGSIQF